MRLRLARTATVLALLDRTTLGVDVVEIPIFKTKLALRVVKRRTERHTSVVATAHAVALDAGRASPFLAIDNRHTGAITAECGRRSWLRAAG